MNEIDTSNISVDKYSQIYPRYRTTPVGVASLIAVALLGTKNISAAIKSLGMFSLTVFTGLVIYQLLVVPMYFFLVTRTNPYTFLISLGRPWMVSFAAASS